MPNQDSYPCDCTPSNPTIQQCVEHFYETLPAHVVAQGVSVGVVDGSQGGSPVVTKCYSGYADASTQSPIAENTVFEIGSVSKTFTTTMLASAVELNLMDLDATAQSYYDQFGVAVTLPVYGSGAEEVEMTLLDLADFTSGLPDKSPTNIVQGTYNQYTVDMMYDYLNDLAQQGLSVAPGTQYKYVNTNFGMIADLVMREMNIADYEALVEQLISLLGLDMPNTGVITSNSPSIAHLAQGYQMDGTADSNYALSSWPALLGGGGIYSTIDDMLQWLQFNMGLIQTQYANLLALTHKVWFSESAESSEGLGWFIQELEGGGTRIDKNGGTNNFHAYLGFYPESTIGVVVLCNSAMPAAAFGNSGSPVDNLGKAILRVLNRA